jgi:hypothetical protein
VTDEPDRGAGKLAPRFGFTQPLCERCWWSRPEAETKWVRIRSVKRINGVDRIRISRKVPERGLKPYRVLDTADEPREGAICCECGYPTWSGIYLRVDPATVPFPTPKEDE